MGQQPRFTPQPLMPEDPAPPPSRPLARTGVPRNPEPPGPARPARDPEQQRVDRKIFWEHVAAFAMLNLVVGWAKYTVWSTAPWDLWVPLGWGAALALHGLWAYGRLG